ncbi:MBL fold metallo-hydrolase [Acetohalobium arabaticum]|uniref:Putative metal dependent hydrolase n=1 Tax=Acetohalobium arabaticum (strain ATCC 49924 / DSM 5501 / Z-7288) TaxID=574087 RepID=D9QVC1_ACEAZ|nr:MBL fold metallo-hydrolase [Acetohalobium arabaticum]ADL12180.1 putative metal dependent hydrolase [Acetohalobium arabaticum DSM 5501]
MTAEIDIYHLYHSGICIKTENYCLVFDYCNDQPAGEEKRIENGVLTTEELAEQEKGLVFVTHNHGDHFNPVIFDWAEELDTIEYILSNDVQVQDQENRHKVGKYQELKLDDVYIETYGTTDQGVSFYVEVDGFNIFHSGDLNWWHWKKFTLEERKQEEVEFKQELDRLEGKEIDIACVPVDHRLEEHYYLAGRYFAETIEPEMIVPIHFRDNYYITSDFVDEIADLPVNAVEITERGQKIIFN